MHPPWYPAGRSCPSRAIRGGQTRGSSTMLHFGTSASLPPLPHAAHWIQQLHQHRSGANLDCVTLRTGLGGWYHGSATNEWWRNATLCSLPERTERCAKQAAVPSHPSCTALSHMQHNGVPVCAQLYSRSHTPAPADPPASMSCRAAVNTRN